MTRHSSYIRAMLFARVMNEQSLALHLPDIPSPVWDLMMKYIDEEERMNPFDAHSLRKW
jgi:hypothetical protein